MKTLVALSLLLTAACKSQQTTELTLQQVFDRQPIEWEVTEGLEQPESAYFEPTSQTIFVSNVQGKGTDKDGKGYISQYSIDGKLIKLKWLDGLNAPKGLRSFKNLMVVSDIDRVVVIDIPKAKTAYTVTIKGAKFLNDTAVDSDGNFYVSDMIDNKIYKIQNRKAKQLNTGFDLESPNGLLIDKDILYIASWGRGLKPDYSTEADGNLHSYNLKTKEHRMITPIALGHLDGLEKISDDTFLVSDWMAGKVFEVKAGGVSRQLLQGFQGSADIGFIESTRTLLVPRMKENRLTAFRY